MFYTANRAHHADVGGMSAGSMPLSREIYQEGIIIPPIKLEEDGRINEMFMKILNDANIGCGGSLWIFVIATNMLCATG